MAIGAKVLFAAEDFCWPDASLAVSFVFLDRSKASYFPLSLYIFQKQYPNEETIGHRYLNSGGW